MAFWCVNHCLVLNGKKADQPEIREAVKSLREVQHQLDVRVNWEAGDIGRLVAEAREREIDRLIIGGGDGSINEATNAILNHEGKVPSMGILPLGTANDFATACHIPADPLLALRLALTGTARRIDAVQANERFFLNVASAGFGAACNGRTTGGGQPLAVDALVDDGLLDVIMISHFAAADAPQVLQEFRNPGVDGDFVHWFRTPWLECDSDHAIPVNLDGEPYSAAHIRFTVRPGAIEVVLPPDCPCIGQPKEK